MVAEDIRYNASVVRGFIAFSRVIGKLVLLASLAVLVGWGSNLQGLQPVLDSSLIMRAGAAVAGLIAAAAMLLAPRAPRTSIVLSLLLAVFGGAELVGYVSGWNGLGAHGLDRWLLVATGRPFNHMTPVAALGFALIGALGAGVVARCSAWLREVCAFAVIAIAMGSAASYGPVLAGGESDLLAQLPVMTALTLLLLLALAWLSSEPTRGLTRIAVADSVGGAVARRLILPALLLPVLLTFLLTLMQSWWRLSPALTLAMASVATGGTVATMIVWVAFLLDRSERQRRTVLALREDAHTDGLTGLVNRRGFDETFAVLLAEAIPGTTVAVLMLDLDHFKRFNDSFGHQAGDEVLRATGRLLRGEVRPRDLVARYGGEEFVIVLPDSDAERAERVAQRILVAFRQHAWPLRPVTVSIGATIAAAGEAGEVVLHRADQALYCSKQQGRDRLMFDGGPCQGVLAAGPVLLP